jgi:thiamine pyrophosphokinase
MNFKTFRFVLPDVLVCLNGILPERSFFEHIMPLPIAAADGAAKKLREKGILPNYIVGDLDSIADEVEIWREQKEIIIQEISDQNTTDYEKTLAFVDDKGAKNIMVCGLHGGDLDHTLNNWSITMRESSKCNIAVIDNGKVASAVRKSVRFETMQNEMISLIPQPSARLTTSGLEWNLSNEVLGLGIREGARNQATGNVVELQIHEGSVFVFQKARLPYMPILE